MSVRPEVESRRWELSRPAETRAAARRLAERWVEGTSVALIGPLGAGKTTFVRGVVEGLGAPPGAVRSPTYMLVREYPTADPTVAHADLYRARDAAAQRTIGLEEYFERGVLLVEWAQHWRGRWPASTETVRMSHAEGGGRTLRWFSAPPGEVDLGPRKQAGDPPP